MQLSADLNLQMPANPMANKEQPLCIYFGAALSLGREALIEMCLPFLWGRSAKWNSA